MSNAVAVLPFILFIIYDINSVIWKIKILNSLFAVGFALIIFNTIAIVRNNRSDTAANYFILAPAVLCLTMLIYALFFALPFADTYVKCQKPPHLCKTGLYAMCRHPGVIWFTGFYFFLYLLFPSAQLAVYSAISCICNILYVVFQDYWSFPKAFADYGAYKDEVPFILPDIESFQNGLITLKNRGSGKNES